MNEKLVEMEPDCRELAKRLSETLKVFGSGRSISIIENFLSTEIFLAKSIEAQRINTEVLNTHAFPDEDADQMIVLTLDEWNSIINPGGDDD